MSSESKARPPLVRFLDGFFQEQNIQWMLGVGMVILLGSSLRLVTAQWESYTAVWKYLILVGYTAGIHVAGQASYRLLGLRRTGTGLMALTLLLLPITFLALRWIHPDAAHDPAALLRQAGLIGLLVANVVLTVAAGRRILGHFLRGRQPTFVASYIILCVAGAVVPAVSAQWGAAVALGLWGVFAAGTVKVNRHVFWLAEEHRRPRIFGFFPIALLGTQFVTLFALHLAPHVAADWMGLGLVLTAIPVLLTADAVAGVFEQRTGGLVRPYPWSVVAPLLAGLVLCAAGVCLSATGWPRPLALVPTAALTAGLLLVVARRTGQPGVVWAMLAAVLVAYNFSPVFFRDAARQLVEQGAAAVRERRLPLAFYGLTYLPLLAVLTGLACRAGRRGNELFARPLRRFVIGLEGVLLAVSLTHPKAVFPVGVVLAVLLAVQTVLFGERRVMPLGIAAWMAAAAGLPAFIAGVLGWPLPADALFLSLATCAATLLVPGAWFDRWSLTASRSGDAAATMTDHRPWCRAASLAVTLALAACWPVWLGWTDPHVLPWGSGLLLSVLLVAHALIWLAPGLGEAALVFAGIFAASVAMWSDLSDPIFYYGPAVLLGGLWLLSYLLPRWPAWRCSRAFARPARHVGGAGLLIGLIFGTLPFAMAVILGIDDLAWLPGLITVAWAFDAARRLARWPLAVLGWLGVLGLVGAGMVAYLGPGIGQTWLMLAWSVAAVVALPVIAWLRRCATGGRGWRLCEAPASASMHNDSGASQSLSPGHPSRCHADEGWDVLANSLAWSVTVTLLAVAVVSLAGFTLPSRLAGGVAVGGLLFCDRAVGRRVLRTLALMLLNAQGLAAVVGWCCPRMAWLGDLSWPAAAAGVLPVALAAAVSRLIWQWRLWWESSPERELAETHATLLGLLTGVLLLMSLRGSPFGLPAWSALFVTATFAALILGELRTACRAQQEDRVWRAVALVVAAVGDFAFFGWIAVDEPAAMFVALAAAGVMWGVGRWATRLPQATILTRPLTQTAMALPLAAVALGIGRHLLVPHPQWKGLNSLALLLAAAFYFWRGLEHRRPVWLVLSAGIVNIALALLWRELAWSDPQFFLIPLGASVLLLVELLRAEIPNRFHDPLRYAGALVILVSPTFHIVGGSWAHIISLMVLSVAVALVAMGLRVRALMYAGTAFLMADVAAMVVRGSLDHPNVLWLAGIAVGASLLTLAAYCEKHREEVLQRLRLLAAELETWK